MRAFAIVTIVVITAVLINWIRAGQAPFHIVNTLPLLTGKPIAGWDGAAIIMLLIGAWGISRLRRGPRP